MTNATAESAYLARQRRVLIYIPHLLPVYQPWARHHAQLLPRFETMLAGRKRAVPTLDIEGIAHFSLDAFPFGKLEGSILLINGRGPRLERAIAAFAPDLIHAHFATSATEIMDIANRLDVPLVVTYHGWDSRISSSTQPLRPYDRLHLARRERMFDQAALILTVSEWLRQEVVALGADEKKTEVHYLGVDRQVFDGIRSSDGSSRVAMVGRLVRLKGTHFALEAFRLLLPRVSGLTVEIIGDGPERAALERTVAEFGLPVSFLGAQSQEETRNLLARSRVLCFPSTVTEGLSAEKFGLAAAEAQAMGVPVVGAKTGGIPEAFKQGETGLLVPDANPEALAEALHVLLTEDAVHARMSSAGRALVAEKFDVRKNLGVLADRYDTLLDALGR